MTADRLDDLDAASAVMEKPGLLPLDDNTRPFRVHPDWYWYAPREDARPAVRATGAAQIVPLGGERTQHHYLAFVRELRATCCESYFKRFDRLQPMEAFLAALSASKVTLLAYRDGKVVGAADFSEAASFAPGTVAVANAVVLDGYRREGIGAALFEEMEERMNQRGFRYAVKAVHVDNDALIERLLKRGFRQSTPRPDDEDLLFWRALDPAFRDIEPTREW